MPDATLTCLDLWFRAGSSLEKAGEEGLAHFLEHMVFKGSNTHKAGEFDRKIEALGGSSNAATGFDDVHFYVQVPQKVVEPALELLIDLVINPALLPDPFAMEREVVLEEIAQHNDQPEEQVFQQLLSSCWKDHPYGRPILGLKESLENLTPKRMKDFHNRLYTSENCCLSIAGGIQDEMIHFINRSHLSTLSPKNASIKGNAGVSRINFKTGRETIQIARLESARILKAWPIAAAHDQQLIMGADIATTIFCEGRSSRLIRRLREELQIVESVDMDITVLEQGGLVLLEACCKVEDVEQVEDEINNLLIESLITAVDKKELDRACHLVRNSLCFSLELPSQIAGMAGTHMLWGRQQSLLAPLQHIQYWSAERLKKEILCELQPQKSYTLIATPLSV